MNTGTVGQGKAEHVADGAAVGNPLWHHPAFMNLVSTSVLHKGECISLIGAGGKTTIGIALRLAARTRDLTVMTTTTTKIWPPSRSVVVASEDAHERALRTTDALASSGEVTVAAGFSSQGKLLGMSVEELATLASRAHPDVIICEADGAAGRLLKVHAPHEPVVPPVSSLVIIVANVQSVGESANDATVHRIDRYRHLFPRDNSGPITPLRVAEILCASRSRVASSVPILYVLHGADDARAEEPALAIAAHLASRDPAAQVAITSSRRHSASSRHCSNNE